MKYPPPSGYRIPSQPYTQLGYGGLYLPASVGGLRSVMPSSGGGGGPAYDWTQDKQILSRLQAGSLIDLAASPAWGPTFSLPSGMPTLLPNALDGSPAASFVKGGAPRIVSGTSTAQFGPFHIFLIGRCTNNGGAPAYPDLIIGDSLGVDTRVFANGATNILDYSGGTGMPVPCTTTNFNMLNMYSHGYQSRYSVNGGAYSATQTDGPYDILNGIIIGGKNDGSSGVGYDFIEMMIVEGQASAPLLAGWMAYCRGKYPSLGVAVSPPAQFSTSQQTLSLVGAGTDFFIVGGQSNDGNNTSMATTAPTGTTFLFDSSDGFYPMRGQYDNVPTGNVDNVQHKGSGLGGNATSMANAYSAGTGRPVVVLPIASGGSAMSVQGAAGLITNTWQRDAYSGRNNQKRNTNYWSAVARVKNLVALGLTFRYLHWYQGEAEAVNGPAATHAALTLAFFNSFFADCGLPQRVIIQPIANTVLFATSGDIATIQAGQASLALAGTRLVGTPWAGAVEADGVHVTAAGQNTIGANGASLALAQAAGTGWH